MIAKNMLVTGASGYIGSQLVKKLVEYRSEKGLSKMKIVGLDIKPAIEELEDVPHYVMDIQDSKVSDVIRDHNIDSVIHLAAIVSPSKTMTREFIYKVEVEGTKNVLDACVKNGVTKFVNTSSGAAYGYYADSPEWLKESDPIRGNEEMPYPYHKRLVEEMLAEYRKNYPGLKQLIFRVCTILGDKTDNQITDMFWKPNVMGVRGTDTPFVFIWDQDLIACLMESALTEKEGIYNIAGDGTVTLRQIAKILKKPFIALPPNIVKNGLKVLKFFGATQYDPEEIKFIQYRPVLDNAKLKNEFGYTPMKTSREVFDYYLNAKGVKNHEEVVA